jgi:putative cardiolipin synthase
VLAALAIMTGCASINYDYPRQESYVLDDTDQTLLARMLDEVTAFGPPGTSGFYLLPDGIEALAMRLRLIKSAQVSIDLQVYILKPDITGSVILHRLLEAADRGVRVRVLLDDVYTSGHDAGLAGLSSHPNIEIRVYNPFKRGFAGRTGSVLTDFDRVNRRMHNKNLVIDNTVAISGGRNIADDYFDAREDMNFSDLDVFAIGPVVASISGMFDTYWNHQTALPLPAFIKMPNDPGAELERVRKTLAQTRNDALDSPYAAALTEEVAEFIDLDTRALSWATWELVYDSPDKGVIARKHTTEVIRTPLAETLESAKEELVIVSPYFVPRESGMQRFEELRQKDVEVAIITNPLASQNQSLVHGGYAPSRKPLLAMGVQLYEIRPDADQSGTEFVDPGDTRVTLHTKAFLVDREIIFVGSFNFDPRSAFLNTESGLIIHSPELAQQFGALVDSAFVLRSYELFLDPDEKLRWRYDQEGQQVVYEKEPETSWGKRFSARFVGIFPIKSQL